MKEKGFLRNTVATGTRNSSGWTKRTGRHFFFPLFHISSLYVCPGLLHFPALSWRNHQLTCLFFKPGFSLCILFRQNAAICYRVKPVFFFDNSLYLQVDGQMVKLPFPLTSLSHFFHPFPLLSFPFFLFPALPFPLFRWNIWQTKGGRKKTLDILGEMSCPACPEKPFY